jgi:cytochrome b6-f complex iron-sulfur subunit
MKKRANTMKQNKKDTTIPEPDRRKILNWLWAFFGLAGMAEFGWLGVSFMNSRKERNQPVKNESIVVAGPVAQFKPATVTAIPQGQFYVACLEDGGFLAISRTCTHLGCSIPWDEEKNQFVCPCHGSTFSLTGEVLTAPAPRPLDIYPVRIENGIVKVDVSTAERREHFDQGQATRI